MHHLILGTILTLGMFGCAKPKPPEPLSVEEVEAARQHFNRHPAWPLVLVQWAYHIPDTK